MTNTALGESMENEMQLMMARIAHIGEISEAEARRIVNEIYKDGIVSRDEAETLFRLNNQLAERDPVWVERFIEAIKDFLLTREAPEGWITDDEADWLIAQMSADGHIETASEIDLMLTLLRYADGARAGEIAVAAAGLHRASASARACVARFAVAATTDAP